MQPLPILLVLAILLADDGFTVAGVLGVAEHPWLAPAVALSGPAVAVALAAILVARRLRQVDATGHGRGLGRADSLLRRARWAIVGLHLIAVIAAGWLDWVRRTLVTVLPIEDGDLVLVDEGLALLPAVLGLAGLWAVQHGLEVRVANSLRIRRIDHGMPIWPTPGRGAWVLSQIRVQLGMLGVPVLLVIGAGELVHAIGGDWAAAGASVVPDAAPSDAPAPSSSPGSGRIWVLDAITLAAGATIFIVAPLIMRVVLPLAPIESAAVRRSLAALSVRAGVGVRDVLLWRSDGAIINAAVVGLIRPIRFIIVTDGLVEQLPEPALRAVLAHEIGHVRFRHVPWLAVSLGGLATVGAAVASLPSLVIGLNAGALDGTASQVSLVVSSLLMLAGGWAVFGWVARRYERQADTFAVRLLSQDPREELAMTPSSVHWLRDRPATTIDGPDDLGAGDLGPGVTSGPATGGGEEPGAPTPAATRPAATPGEPADGRVTHEAIVAMRAALLLTASLSGMDPDQRSWWHGSIRWRGEYLAGLTDQPILGLPIDRTVRRLKIAALLLLLAGGASIWALDRAFISIERSSPPMAAGDRVARGVQP